MTEAEFEARLTELLAANGREVERRRAAETEADRLRLECAALRRAAIAAEEAAERAHEAEIWALNERDRYGRLANRRRIEAELGHEPRREGEA
jgi:hypothetical protein